MEITKEYLRNNPSYILVFEDTADGEETKGYASLRHLQNTYGLVLRDTKFCDARSYSLEHYEKKFYKELAKLITAIETNPEFTFLISKMNASPELNQAIYEPKLKGLLKRYKNVKFIFDEDVSLKYYCGYIDQRGKLAVHSFNTREEAQLKIDVVKDSKIAIATTPVVIKSDSFERAVEELTNLLTNRDYFDND